MSEQQIIKRFAELLAYVSDGEFVNRLDDELAEIFAALEADEGGKTASLTIKIKFERSGRRQLEISGDSAVKLPAPPKLPPSTFWRTKAGVSLEHPQQIPMFPPARNHADA